MFYGLCIDVIKRYPCFQGEMEGCMGIVSFTLLSNGSKKGIT